MVFSSVEFLVFMSVVLLLFWGVLSLLPHQYRNRARHLLLVVASCFFYMSWNAKFIVLILGSSMVDYVAGAAIARADSLAKRRLWLAVSLVANLGTLAVFKYANFFLGNVNGLIRLIGGESSLFAQIVLPVGISFYTFQTMSYTIDIYRDQLQPIRSFTRFLLYVSFFPQLVAGPIVRAADFLPQLDHPIRAERLRLNRSIKYFLMGMVKKVLISDWVSLYSDQVFANPAAYNGVTVWLGVIAYAIQIYCDFSGYTDMAIGTAGLFGYELPINFNMPYLSANITEFWRRWHISLSTWLRDYLYISVGGNRGSRLFTYRNLMIVMLLGGLWHGASWTFLVWGGLHGFALILHRELRRRIPERLHGPIIASAVLKVASTAITFLFVCVAWVFFRAQTFDTAFLMIGKMLTLSSEGILEVPGSLITASLIMVISHWIGSRNFNSLIESEQSGGKWPLEALAYAVVIFALLLFAPDGTQPFIYFQF